MVKPRDIAGECRGKRRRRMMEPRGTQKKKKMNPRDIAGNAVEEGEPQRYSWGTQKKKKVNPRDISWGMQKEIV